MLQTIAHTFQTVGFQVQLNEDKLIGPYTIQNRKAMLVVRVLGPEDARIVNFEVMGLIPTAEIRQSHHLAAFVQYLLAQNWRFSAGSVEMDTDGEVRVLVELPLADSTLTPKQLRLILEILGRNGAELVTKGLRVLETGSADEDEASDEVPSLEQRLGLDDPETMELFFRFKEMAQTAEGRAQLVQLKSQPNCPNVVIIMIDAAMQAALPDAL